MRSLVVEMIDKLVADLAQGNEESTDGTIDRLEEIRNVAKGASAPRVDCTGQYVFPAVETAERVNGARRSQTNSGGTEGDSK